MQKLVEIGKYLSFGLLNYLMSPIKESSQRKYFLWLGLISALLAVLFAGIAYFSLLYASSASREVVEFLSYGCAAFVGVNGLAFFFNSLFNFHLARKA